MFEHSSEADSFKNDAPASSVHITGQSIFFEILNVPKGIGLGVAVQAEMMRAQSRCQPLGEMCLAGSEVAVDRDNSRKTSLPGRTKHFAFVLGLKHT